MSSTPDIDVALDGRESRGSGIPSWVVALIHGGAWLACGAWLMLRVSNVLPILEDFDVELPEVTVLLFELSNVVARFWWLLVPLLVGFTVADWVIDTLFARSRRGGLRIAWFILGLIPPLLLTIIGEISLQVLLKQLVDALS